MSTKSMSHSFRGFTILEALIMLVLLGGFSITSVAILRKDYFGHDPNSRNQLWKIFDFLPSMESEDVIVEGLPPEPNYIPVRMEESEEQYGMDEQLVPNDNLRDMEVPSIQPEPSGEGE